MGYNINIQYIWNTQAVILSRYLGKSFFFFFFFSNIEKRKEMQYTSSTKKNLVKSIKKWENK